MVPSELTTFFDASYDIVGVRLKKVTWICRMIASRNPSGLGTAEALLLDVAFAIGWTDVAVAVAVTEADALAAGTGRALTRRPVDATAAGGAAARRLAATARFCGPRADELAAVPDEVGLEWAEPDFGAEDADDAAGPSSAAAMPHPTLIEAPTPTAISAAAAQPEHGKPEAEPSMSTPRSDNASRLQTA
jgi:hypothetical protein